MSLKYHKDVSFSVAVFYLKIVGLWLSTNLVEKWFRNALVTYTVLAIIFNMWMQLRGLYFSWGDFSVSISRVLHNARNFLNFNVSGQHLYRVQ